MSIVTKTGDKGTTGLYGGARLPKDHPRICAYGDVDELNAILGVVLASVHLSVDARKQLTDIQHLLFRVGGDLATPMQKESKQERVSAEHVARVEEWINVIENSLLPQKSFILPGGTSAAAHVHHARTVCRRAERSVVSLQKIEPVNPDVQVLLNRLSDYFFLLARKLNAEAKVWDTEVKY
ncbi:MAG: cob(I)yrinic acid a,c-diamide adenosyltransferase [Candidatus Peribacteraceae bacterium]|nr:cob(I)yrinic acid a,c-diamide adenosyltransferase [Candidatus Peribacteraceae bacterium]